jgi:hypothetical protein
MISFKAIDISFLELYHLLIAKFVFYVFVHLFLSEKPWYLYYSLFEAMISTDKTNGKLKHSKDKVENISWIKQKTIPSPGIYLDHDYIECEKFNWEKKIERIDSFTVF